MHKLKMYLSIHKFKKIRAALMQFIVECWPELENRLKLAEMPVLSI